LDISKTVFIESFSDPFVYSSILFELSFIQTYPILNPILKNIIGENVFKIINKKIS